MKKKPAVIYCRVSTKKQGRDKRLGFRIQAATIYPFLESNNYFVLKEFFECGSSMNDGRPDVLAAIELCKAQKATLFTSAVHRLTRRAGFMEFVNDTGIEYIPVDNPQASKFMKIMLALFARYTWENIKDNAIKNARERKKQGKKLGTNGKKLSRYFRKRRQRHDKRVRSRIVKLYQRGLSFRAIADELNRCGVPTPSGYGKWHFSTVYEWIKRTLMGGTD